MRGHEALIALRQRRRVRPAIAFVDLVAQHSSVPADWQQWATQAHLEVTDAESIGRLDMRCLVGLHVIASGFDAERVAQLHEACIAAGAARVTSAVIAWRGEEIRTVAMRDSVAEQREAGNG